MTPPHSSALATLRAIELTRERRAVQLVELSNRRAGWDADTTRMERVSIPPRFEYMQPWWVRVLGGLFLVVAVAGLFLAGLAVCGLVAFAAVVFVVAVAAYIPPPITVAVAAVVVGLGVYARRKR